MTFNKNTTINFVKVKAPLYKRILSHPFKYYLRGSNITFGIVMTGNIIASLANYGQTDEWKPKKIMVENPQLYTIGLLTKCMYFGILWPSFYLTMLQDPKRVFVMWNPENYEWKFESYE